MKKTIAFLLAVSLILMSGCGAVKKNGKNGSVIAVSFYPVYIFTLNLVKGIDTVDVRCMAQQNTGCLHDYTLTARDARLLNDADVFVISGAGMETFLDDLEETTENLPVIDSSVGIELLCGDSHEHEDEHGETDHLGHSHEHGENSHIWMSVENAEKQVINIKDGLLKVFPQHENEINANCEEYLERLRLLKTEIQSASDCLKGENVITFHAAYDYASREIGFNVIATVESDEGGEPSAKELARLCDEIRENNVKALFIEPEYDGNAAQILATETGAEIYVLNPVVKGDGVLTAYEDIMRENIEIMKKAVK